MNRWEFEKVVEELTPRRRQVLKLLLAGMADRDIARRLHIEESTVRKHIEKICKIFALNNKYPGERRTLRPDLIALFAQYMPQSIETSENWQYTQINSQLNEEVFPGSKSHGSIFSIYNRDVFILIDKSGSMVRKDADTGNQTRYEYLAEVVEGHIGAILSKYSAPINKTGEKICDRLSLFFFSTAKAKPNRIVINDASQVWRLFVENQPQTKSFIGPTLEYCLNSWLNHRKSDRRGAFFIIYTDGQFDDEEKFIDCIASACANISNPQEVKFFVLGLGEEINIEYFLALDFNLYKTMPFNVFVFDLVNEVDDIIELLSRQLTDDPHLAIPDWVRFRYPTFVERVVEEKNKADRADTSAV